MKRSAPSELMDFDGSERSHWATVKDLLHHLWPADNLELRARVAIAITLLIAAKGVFVLIPLIYKAIVDALTGATTPGEAALTGDLPTVVTVPLMLLLAYGGARVMSMVFQELRDAIFAKVGQRASRQVALRVFKHLHALSLRFHLERQTGGLSRIIERGTRGIGTLLNFSTFFIVPTFLELTLSTGLLWALFGHEVAIVTFITIFFYIIYTYKVTNWRLKLRRHMNDTDQKANTHAIDSLINYETVKYFNNEDHEARRYDTGMMAYEKAATASMASLSLLNIGQAAIMATGTTVLLLMAAYRVAKGEMTIGDFVAINAYIMQMAGPLNFFGTVYREIKQALVDMEQMFSLLLVNAEIQDDPKAKALAHGGGEIRFDAVHFAYHPDRPILQGISFTVPAGKRVAVVGPSGAGKSTLSRLLYRFYDIQDGAVTIDGQDIRDVTQSSLRASIGIVPQDTVLFNDTLGYNIAYGRPEASTKDIQRAIRLARLDHFIQRLPEGLETMVGERGLKLSGGEKQRVAIARAILKNPEILMFDEATSALDSQTEQEILKSLQEVSKGRTTLIIAHRLSTIIDADEIIVLDHGRVVERGNHRSLLAHNKVYAGMWRRQQEQEPDAAAPLATGSNEKLPLAQELQ